MGSRQVREGKSTPSPYLREPIPAPWGVPEGLFYGTFVLTGRGYSPKKTPKLRQMALPERSMDMAESFSQRLKKYRKAKNLTQQELAEQIGVSDKTVSRWERAFVRRAGSPVRRVNGCSSVQKKRFAFFFMVCFVF